MKNISALLLALLTPLFILAQTHTITGVLVDQSTKETLIGALVSVTSTQDTTVKFNTVSNASGMFTFQNVPDGPYNLRIQSLGFKAINKPIKVQGATLHLGTLLLEVDQQLLHEVEVTEVMQRAVQKGDTTQFNADAFKTNPDANAEDLIKKMPGVTVENGVVNAQGEKVQQVLVDGKPFFGDDANAALKNLPAQAIQKVEVFDRKSDQAQFTGYDDGEEKKTINIITRPEYRNGTFGRAFAGGGTDDRYQAGGNVNNFKDDRRISVVGLSNNINQQNFGNEDLLGVVGTSANTGGGRRRRGPSVDSDPNDFMVGDQSGINTTHSIGINYTDEFGEKLKLNASYFFNRTENNTEQLISQTNFLSDTTNQLYNSLARGNSANNNHRINVRMEYKMNENNSIIFTPKLSFQTNSSASKTQASTAQNDGILLNQTVNSYGSDLSAYNFGGDLLWQHKFAKRGRTISVVLRGSANDNNGTTELIALNKYYGNILSTDSISQFGFPNTQTQTIGTRTRYTEPLGKKGQLMISHNYEASFGNSNKETYNFDPDTGVKTSLDTNLSNVFSSLYQEQQIGPGYRYNDKKFNAGIGFYYQYASLTSDLKFPTAGEINKTFNNILPWAMLRYNISKEKNLRFFYRARTNAPTAEQLQNVVDNSNPLQLTVGNPNLKQAYGNFFVMRYSNTNAEKGRSFSAYVRLNQYNDYVTNATLIAQKDTLVGNGVTLNKGAQLIYPVNLDGYWGTSGNVTWGVPAGFLRSNLNFSTSASYTRTPGLINEIENISNTVGISQGIGLTSNISEKIDFNINFNANVNLVDNTLQPDLNNNYYIQTSSASVSWYFLQNWVARTSFTHQWYTGLTDTFNQNFALWNASLGYKVFKNKQGEISLSVFDILNQNKSISRIVTESYVQDVETLVLQQYFMLTFTYNFKAFKG